MGDKKEGEISLAFLRLKQLKSISGVICQARTFAASECYMAAMTPTFKAINNIR
jgi:hypothetical protein